jgi:integrase/recombinase XerD
VGSRSGPELLTPAFWKHFPHVQANEAAFAWVEELCTREYADTTVLGYAGDLESYLADCKLRSIDAVTARLTHVDSHFKSLNRKNQLAPATLRRRASTLKMWYDFMVADERALTNPFRVRLDPHASIPGHRRSRRRQRGRAYIKGRRTPPWIPNEPEFQRLIDHVRNPLACSERDRFMLLLSYECALRAIEVVAGNVEDIDFENMEFFCVGKGGREDYIPFSQSLADAWPAFIAERSQFVSGGGPLFVSYSNRNIGQRLKKGTWNDRLAVIRKAVDLPRFHPHTIRHLALTDLARGGMPLLALKDFARHESVETTKIYIHLSRRDIVRAYRKAKGNVHLWRAQRFLLDVNK